VKTLIISSDSAYSSTLPANINLNSLFRLKEWAGSSAWKGISVDSTVKLLNENGYRGIMKFFITQKPGNTKTHKFKLFIEFENGEKVEAITKPVTWL
jgi:hypothetical protein